MSSATLDDLFAQPTDEATPWYWGRLKLTEHEHLLVRRQGQQVIILEANAQSAEVLCHTLKVEHARALLVLTQEASVFVGAWASRI